KSRHSELSHANAERFVVTHPGKVYRWDVYLFWASSNSQTRPVEPGDLNVYGSAEQVVRGKVLHCHARVGFHVEATHVYQVTLDHPYETGECMFTVQDKASGELLTLQKLD